MQNANYMTPSAASTPTYSFREGRMRGQERRPTIPRQQGDLVGLATRSRIQSPSERKIIVLPCRHLHSLAPQHRERLGDAGARGARHDHVVDIAALGGGKG